jgi:hypothetical protein
MNFKLTNRMRTKGDMLATLRRNGRVNIKYWIVIKNHATGKFDVQNPFIHKIVDSYKLFDSAYRFCMDNLCKPIMNYELREI